MGRGVSGGDLWEEKKGHTKTRRHEGERERERGEREREGGFGFETTMLNLTTGAFLGESGRGFARIPGWDLPNGVEEAAALVALHEFLTGTGLDGDVWDNLDIASTAVFALEGHNGGVTGVEEAAVGV